MSKKEIFDAIVLTAAEVCNVSADDILNGARREDVVTARSIAVFWADAAGFSVESLLACTERDNANSINSIKARIEDYWVNRFAYHMLVVEVGKRLLDKAHEIGEEFDMWKPVRKLQVATRKY